MRFSNDILILPRWIIYKGTRSSSSLIQSSRHTPPHHCSLADRASSNHLYLAAQVIDCVRVRLRVLASLRTSPEALQYNPR